MGLAVAQEDGVTILMNRDYTHPLLGPQLPPILLPLLVDVSQSYYEARSEQGDKYFSQSAKHYFPHRHSHPPSACKGRRTIDLFAVGQILEERNLFTSVSNLFAVTVLHNAHSA